jgi:heavy-metal resistance protein
MRRWWLVIALLLSVGLNVGILAAIAARRAAEPPPAMDRGPRPEMANPGGDPLPKLPRLADHLGLEGEERRKFLDIQWNLYQETSRLRLQLGEVHREIRRELTRPEPDRGQLDRLLNESARIYLALERSLIKNVLATRELLDSEQERQYMALIGRLRIAGGGLGGPGLAPGAQRLQRPAEEGMRQRMMEERMRQRLEEQRSRRQGFQDRFPQRRRRFGGGRREDAAPPP